jgi:hypothetical protein
MCPINIKTLLLLTLMAAAAFSLLGPVQAQQAQTPSVADIKATAAAIQTLQVQQKTLTDNQTAIDGKLATIAEEVRVARLFQSRAK